MKEAEEPNLSADRIAVGLPRWANPGASSKLPGQAKPKKGKGKPKRAGLRTGVLDSKLDMPKAAKLDPTWRSPMNGVGGAARQVLRRNRGTPGWQEPSTATEAPVHAKACGSNRNSSCEKPRASRNKPKLACPHDDTSIAKQAILLSNREEPNSARSSTKRKESTPTAPHVASKAPVQA